MIGALLGVSLHFSISPADFIARKLIPLSYESANMPISTFR